jgi:hypothetical protein
MKRTHLLWIVGIVILPGLLTVQPAWAANNKRTTVRSRTAKRMTLRQRLERMLPGNLGARFVYQRFVKANPTLNRVKAKQWREVAHPYVRRGRAGSALASKVMNTGQRLETIRAALQNGVVIPIEARQYSLALIKSQRRSLKSMARDASQRTTHAQKVAIRAENAHLVSNVRRMISSPRNATEKANAQKAWEGTLEVLSDAQFTLSVARNGSARLAKLSKGLDALETQIQATL